MPYSSRPPSPSERRRSAVAPRALLIALLAVVASVGSAAGASVAADFAVVVSPDVELTSCSSAELRHLFGLERQFWKAGRPVVVLLPEAGSHTHAFLLRRVYRTDEDGLKRLMLEKLYRGEIDLAPKVVGSDREALSFVASSRGLIALVPASLVDGADVRVLRIDGKLPGASGYPLTE
jgi:hypothetical protein